MGPALKEASPAFGRWTDEEHDILVQLTIDQLALEKQDRAAIIPWAKHWKRVSARLKEHKYNRSFTACLGYWKRCPESKKGNDEAAGPSWDEYEHGILVRMTEDQLAEETKDPSAVIPWGEHWAAVSLRLEENGYERGSHECEAYWSKVDVEDSCVVPLELNGTNERSERYFLDTPRAPKTQRPSEGAETYWQNESKLRSDPASKSSTHSAVKSGHTENDLDPIKFNLATPRKPDPAQLLKERDESDISEYEPHGISRKQKNKNARASTQPEPESVIKKEKNKNIRFTPEQKATLEEEGEKNGWKPDIGKRLVLAHQLGVDPTNIRNWFGNARSKARKSFTSTDATTSTTNIDPTNTNEPSTPDLKKKRRRDTLDSIDDSPRNEQAQKKLRLGGEPSPRGVEQALPSSTLTEAAPPTPPQISAARQESPVSTSTVQQSSASNSASETKRTQTSSVSTTASQSTSPIGPNGGSTWKAVNSPNGSMGSDQPQQRSAVIGSTTRPIPDSCDEGKAWASKETHKLQTVLQDLRNKKATNLVKITSIEQQIAANRDGKNRLRQKKEEETARLLKEIQERYEKNTELYDEKEVALKKAKEAELEELKSNEFAIEHNETGAKRLQAVVDFYNGM